MTQLNEGNDMIPELPDICPICENDPCICEVSEEDYEYGDPDFNEDDEDED